MPPKNLRYLLALGSSLAFLPVHGEDTFPISSKYTSDLEMSTRSKGAGTSERLRNEAGTIFDSWADISTTDRDPRSYAVDTTIERSSYGLVNRSQGSISARLSMRKVRINTDRTDSISSLEVSNDSNQSDWMVFRDQRDIEDDTTPFELVVFYTARFLSGNTGTATSAFESFSTDFLFQNDDETQLIEHQCSYERRNGDAPLSEGFGSFRETFTLLPGERFRISCENDALVRVGFKLVDDANSTNGISRTIAGGGALSWSIRLEAPEYIVQSTSKSGHQWLGRQTAPKSGALRAEIGQYSMRSGQAKIQATTVPGDYYRVFSSEDFSSFIPVGAPIVAASESTAFPLPDDLFDARRRFFWVEEIPSDD